LAALFLSIMQSAQAASDARERHEIPDEFKWDLSSIYPDWTAWDADVARMSAETDAFAALKGTIGQGARQLAEAYGRLDAIGLLQEKIHAYAHLSQDVDTRDQAVAARMQRVEAVFAKFGTATAWFVPELLKIPQGTMEAWVRETPALQPHAFPIRELYRRQAHVLPEDGERLLSYATRFTQTPRSIYRELSTSDIVFPKIKLTDGSEPTLTPGVYQAILATNPNQTDRAAAFEAYLKTYAATKNTYAAIYNAVLQRDWFNARARGHATSLEAALDRDAVPVSVVETLVREVRAGTAPLRRYFALRKRLLGLETYHLYDNNVPLLQTGQTKYPYEEARRLTIESVAPLGADYQERMRALLNGRRTDVFENKGKRSGAYSSGCYGVGPFMLLNHNDTLDAAFTLAHEAGHSLHTLLSFETQPYPTADYTIFVAEVASTLNERLLLDLMLERATDPKERLVLLQHAASEIVGTFYTQVLFANFELEAHRRAEAGEPVTAAVLDGIYGDLLREYYGDAITHDELYRHTWARIPHFYNSPFYVYQYATCFASSAKIYETLKNGTAAEREAARERYLGLLKSGGNDQPMKQLQKAGVDLSDPGTVRAVIRQLETLVDRLEREAGRCGLK
jgi:oligoendopeptidase F